VSELESEMAELKRKQVRSVHCISVMVCCRGWNVACTVGGRPSFLRSYKKILPLAYFILV